MLTVVAVMKPQSDARKLWTYANTCVFSFHVFACNALRYWLVRINSKLDYTHVGNNYLFEVAS